MTMKDREVAIAYTKELRKWYKEREKDKKAPPPPLPRILALDLGWRRFGNGRLGTADTLKHMVKNGYFDSVRVVVFHEKHGERYYLVKELEDFGRIALKTVRERNGNRLFNLYDGCDEDVNPPEPKITMEQAATMDKEIQSTVSALWTRYREAKVRVSEDVRHSALMKKALDGDACAAVQVLFRSMDNEYEGFEVVTPEELS
jgi:hypothetical protein